jgi:hypothetical protein
MLSLLAALRDIMIISLAIVIIAEEAPKVYETWSSWRADRRTRDGRP